MNNAVITMVKAATEGDFMAAKALFIEYQQFLNVDLCFQSFDAELGQLNTMYAAPGGALLLAASNDEFIGCVAVRSKGNGVCEMKRLYVKEAYKGKGIGRNLVAEIIDEAKNLGYHKIILDTLDRLQPALSLYQSMGFKQTTAYYNNPLTGVIYLEKDL